MSKLFELDWSGYSSVLCPKSHNSFSLTGGDLCRDLVDILKDSLGGSYAEQLSIARMFIEQESQLRKADELPVLHATLNLVAADR